MGVSDPVSALIGFQHQEYPDASTALAAAGILQQTPHILQGIVKIGSETYNVPGSRVLALTRQLQEGVDQHAVTIVGQTNLRTPPEKSMPAAYASALDACGGSAGFSRFRAGVMPAGTEWFVTAEHSGLQATVVVSYNKRGPAHMYVNGVDEHTGALLPAERVRNSVLPAADVYVRARAQWDAMAGRLAPLVATEVSERAGYTLGKHFASSGSERIRLEAQECFELAGGRTKYDLYVGACLWFDTLSPRYGKDRSRTRAKAAIVDRKFKYRALNMIEKLADW